MKLLINKYKYYFSASIILICVLGYFVFQGFYSNKHTLKQDKIASSLISTVLSSSTESVTLTSSSLSVSSSATNLISSIIQSVSTVETEQPKVGSQKVEISQVVRQKPVDPIIVAENNKNENKVETAIIASKIEEKNETSSLIKNTSYKSNNCDIQKANQMLDILNNYRVENGKSKFVLIPELNQVACAHSEWMTQSGTFSHTGADLTNAFERCKLAGTYCSAENLAQNTFNDPKTFIEQFKKSSQHNNNMLNGDYSQAGFGFFENNVTQLFR